MTTGVRVVMALLAALVGGAIVFVTAFAALAATESCPPNVEVCDAGMVGNFVLAVLAGFLGALAAGVFAIRRLRDRPSGVEQPPSNERCS
jgi:hypothetical protein